MTPLLILGFVLPVLTGFLLAHVLWPQRQFSSLLLKLFLGIGIGLGLSSILYFIYLLLFAGQGWFLLVQVGLLILLLALAFVQQRRTVAPAAPTRTVRPRASVTVFAGLAAVVFLVSLLSTASYLLRRRQGDWDAWMMYNRAARFVYIDQAHWLQSFSAQMDPIFHADYPLLLAMNITSGWEMLGTDSPHVPMLQSGLFALACVGLAVASLGSVKSLGQAALGLAILWGTPVLVDEGARQMADVPLAFYILATGVLIYLYVRERKPGLLALAGLSAGLAAWTKNEGSLFVIAASVAVVVAVGRSQRFRAAASYLAGLALPLAVVLYFKLRLAPPSDVLSSGPTRSLEQILDPTRHVQIVKFVWGALLEFGAWGVAALPLGILVVLAVYFLLFRAPIGKDLRPAFLAGIVMLLIQAAGYYGIFLITPYDLAWHLSYSTNRLILQLYPLITFLVLASAATPEAVLASASADQQGAQHAAGD